MLQRHHLGSITLLFFFLNVQHYKGLKKHKHVPTHQRFNCVNETWSHHTQFSLCRLLELLFYTNNSCPGRAPAGTHNMIRTAGVPRVGTERTLSGAINWVTERHNISRSHTSFWGASWTVVSGHLTGKWVVALC